MNTSARAIQTLLAHPGTQYSAQLAKQLHRGGSLYRFWTSFAISSSSTAETLLRSFPGGAPKWLDHRIVDLPGDKLRTLPLLEINAVLRMRFGGEPQLVMHRRNQTFQRGVAQSDIDQSDVIVGFDTSSDILADRASKAGKKLILDQTIAHPKSKERVYANIREQFPDWSADLEVRDHAISASEKAEHQKADRIVVASSFTKSTLIQNGVTADKIILNPYGVDLQRFSLPHRKTAADRPLRFVFAGLVCARKGIPLLLQAWKALSPKSAELWIIGPITPTAVTKLREEKNIKILGKIPNTELGKIFAESDVFVFPSYFEGFALVLLEAMACGLPVITTTATAGPDITTNGVDALILEPGDSARLMDHLQFCLANRDRLAQMGQNARLTSERFTWDAYGDRWSEFLRQLAPNT